MYILGFSIFKISAKTVLVFFFFLRTRKINVVLKWFNILNFKIGYIVQKVKKNNLN